MIQQTRTYLIVILVVCLMGLSWLTYKYSQSVVNLSEEGYRPDEGLISAQKDRNWIVAKATKVSLTNSLTGGEGIVTAIGGTFPMTQTVEKGIKNPLTQKTSIPPFAASERVANRVLIQKLINNYGKIVTAASQRFGIPELLIYMIMSVENTEGKASANAGGFIGLMQINTSSAADTLFTQKKRKLLTIDDLKFFQQRFGKSTFVSSASVTNEELKDPETNINVCTLHISEQIVNNKFNIAQDIHKIIISYNRGKNRLDVDGTKQLGIDDMIKRYLGTTHDIAARYIIRALGPNGAGDILVNDLGILA